MSGTSNSEARYVLVTGVARAFGAEVDTRLRNDGMVVIDDLAALPSDAMLQALVVNLTVAPDPTPFRTVTDADMRTLLEDQLYPFVAVVQAAAPRLAPGGSIVQIMPKAYLGAWGGVHVAAVAGACVAMARSMALELAAPGIRVNSVATGRPGDAWDDPSARADIAATVAWLAGTGSGQITGETILADRGASLTMAQAARR